MDPGGAEAFAIAGDGIDAGAAIDGAGGHPAFGLAEEIVLRQGEELVAVVAVPGGDHVGEIVAVGPEGVGMQIALPPLCGEGGGRLLLQGEGKEDEGCGGSGEAEQHRGTRVA